MTIRLLLAEDQELIRKALATLLGLEGDFEVVATVGRGDEVVPAACATAPDVALLDTGARASGGRSPTVSAPQARRRRYDAWSVTLGSMRGRSITWRMTVRTTGAADRSAPQHRHAGGSCDAVVGLASLEVRAGGAWPLALSPLGQTCLSPPLGTLLPGAHRIGRRRLR